MTLKILSATHSVQAELEVLRRPRVPREVGPQPRPPLPRGRRVGVLQREHGAGERLTNFVYGEIGPVARTYDRFQEHAKEVTPPRSPVAAQQLPLLLRGSAAPGGGGPFNPLQHPPEQQRPRPPGGFAAISSNLSVAATSVPSSYEYEDDFTSDEDDVATVADGFSR